MKHYFYEYSTDELMEVIQRQDEWSAFDVDLAKKLLKQQGVKLTPQVMAQLAEKRKIELAQPDEPWKYYFTTGYAFALLGGLLGIVIGFSLYFSKKTVPGGQRVYRFSAPHRKHGLAIISIALISFVLWGIIFMS